MTVEHRTTERNAAIEWPTLALALLIYASWLALTWFHEALPFLVLLPLAAWTVTWHGSLQHEIIHGHPTRRRWLNNLIASPPLILWLPFECYRRTHLAHHNDERLTDPLDDPESRYWTRDQWDSLPWLPRTVLRMQGTLCGRLLFGPLWLIPHYWRLRFASGLQHAQVRRVWLRHVLRVALVLIWVIAVCKMALWVYLVCFVYAGTSLLLLRSFAEHRADSAR